MPLQTTPLFVPIPGGPEMVIIALVLVLLFGANKIPKLARSFGKAEGEFKKGREELDEQIEQIDQEEQEQEPTPTEEEPAPN